MSETILVTGGTGKTGRLVADLLRRGGHDVRVGTRQRAEEGQVHFDWSEPATFGPALTGAAAAYLVAPTDRTDHLAVMRPLLIDAVCRDIGRLVLLSASSLAEGDPMMGEVHGWLHAHAQRWTVLRPSWFMQNFVTQHLPGIIQDNCIYSATQNGRIGFIDASDIAAVAAEALTRPEWPNGDHVLTGPEALSYDEAASMISRASGRTVRHCQLTVDALAGRYRSLGLPGDYAQQLADMDRSIADGVEDRTTDAVERLTGRRPTFLNDFLNANTDSFGPD